jgi:surface carbohydrate biosynthesis protein
MPIETSSRELLYKTYLCNLLALDGFVCYFGSKRNILTLVNKFDNYIYLDKGYHKGVSDSLYRKIESKNGIIVNLDEEGAIDFPDGSTLKSRYSETLFEVSKKIFLWGKYQSKLIADLNLNLNKVSVTGHPRFELLKPQFHNLYDKEVNEIKMKYNDFILINSNFGFGNNIKGDKFVLENYSSRINKIKEIVAFDKVKLQTYIGLVKALAKDKNKTVVYRPHPEENQTIYKDIFKNLDNVHLIFKGSVVPWIIASSVMIHPDCTTGIEAIMVGKKSISFLPENFNPEIVTKLPLDVSFNFNNVDEIIEFIDQKKYDGIKNNKKDFEIINNFFSYDSETTKTIVEELKKIKDDSSNKGNSKLSLKDILVLRAKDYKLNKDTSEKSRLAKNKLKGFDYNYIKILKEKLSGINIEIEKVKIKLISDKLFRLSK